MEGVLTVWNLGRRTEGANTGVAGKTELNRCLLEFEEFSAKWTLVLGLLIYITGRYILMIPKTRPRLQPEGPHVDSANYFYARNLAGVAIRWHSVEIYFRANSMRCARRLCTGFEVHLS